MTPPSKRLLLLLAVAGALTLVLAGLFVVQVLRPAAPPTHADGTSPIEVELASCRDVPANPDLPSFIFILVDTLRADYLGAYGFEGGHTPGIDALAEESFLFERAFSPAPWTKPAVASILTGRPPQSHGVPYYFLGDSNTAEWKYFRSIVLPEQLDTVAERLCEKGYATAAFVTNSWLGLGHGYEQGFEHYDDSVHGGRTKVDDLALARAREWLERRPTDRPFFVYIHLMDPHGPYTAPEVDYEAVRGSPSIERRHLSREEFHSIPDYMLKLSLKEGDNPLDLQVWQGRYAAGVRILDRHLRPFLDYLEEAELTDTSWLFFTSDHGEELHDHGGWDHGYNLYDHQLHVPLIVRPPGEPRPGRRISRMVSLLDLVPTMLHAAQIEPPADLPGQDLALAPRKAPADRADVFATGVRDNPTQFALRSHAYKYILDTATGEEELYDLRADPEEKDDRSGQEQDLILQLRARMVPQLDIVEPVELDELRTVPMDAEMRERLRSLGYISD